MAINKEQAERLGRCTDRFFESLNQKAVTDGSGFTLEDRPWRLCFRSDRRDMVFGVSVRSARGQKHQNGQKWHTYDGPTWQDAELIANTATTDEEVLEAFHDIVFRGIRPMRLRGGGLMNEKVIEAMVAEQVEARVAAVLQKKLAEIAHKQSQRSETVPPNELRVPSVQPPAPEPVEAPKSPNKLLSMWLERAEIIGKEPPTFRRDGEIDGRWMRDAQIKWAAHCKREASGARAEDSATAKT